MTTLKAYQINHKRTFRYICLFVVATHLAFIISVSLKTTPEPILKLPRREKLVVQTVALQPKIEIEVEKTPIKKIEEIKQVKKTEVVPEKEEETIKEKPVEKAVEPIPEKKIASKAEPKPIEVKKPIPKKPIPKQAAAKKNTPQKKTNPPPKPKAKAKQPPKKVEIKKNPPQKREPVVSKPKSDPQAEAIKAKKRELIANAQKKIANIDKPNNSKKGTAAAASTALPTQIDSLQVETFPIESGQTLTTQEITYYDELASRLKLMLRLPEFGEVRIKLTLERSGAFKKVFIVSSESATNRKYVEKTLPTLKYPGFGNNFKGLTEYTFVVSLSNEF